ncbi:endonuclease Q family protein [Paenibacillus sp. y28]|uniref:endonuclease Q family protein n=1 Tax=Paenibacillus sp. y28 TaxID=3129110 RepID=UPI0030170E57
MALQEVYVDLHVHIGRTEAGQPVKISGSRDLTFYNIAKEASQHKGLDVIGIIDCHSPPVLEEMERYVAAGEMQELPGGGIRFGRTTVLLGSEIEIKDPGAGAVHILAFLPDLQAMRDFSSWMSRHMKNVTLSSQRLYVLGRALQEEVKRRGGLFIPAHIFTPYKSVYGSGSSRLAHLFDPALVDAVELGLSADTAMASFISELDPILFVTNSDAHSLPKLGREYNRMRLAEPSFHEIAMALRGEQGRGISANYGLNPRLGKYHHTYCASCQSLLISREQDARRCPLCGHTGIVRGVMDRILDIADREEPLIGAQRPPYIFQVPLEFIPGVGPKLMNKLLCRFGTEMNILHQATREELEEIAGAAIAGSIDLARQGQLSLEGGGGGVYGKVTRRPSSRGHTIRPPDIG